MNDAPGPPLPPAPRWWAAEWGIVAILVTGLVLRVAVMRPEILHVDEALFAAFGKRVAEHFDLLLLDVGFELDRPPALFWVVGGVVSVLGDTPVTIRLPNLAFGLGTIALVYLLVQQLGGGRIGALAGAALLALSPFSVLFGATVFEEPGAVLLGTAALLLVLRNLPMWGGVALGLAMTFKLFAVAYLPLLIGVWLVRDADRLWGAARIAIGFLVVAGLLLTYMGIRTVWFGAPWFLTLQYEHVGGTGLLPPAEWGPRLGAWTHVMSTFAALPAVIIGAVGVGVGVARELSRGRLAIPLLIAFTLAYFALMTVMLSPIYDRYLSYLLPPLSVAAGAGIGWAAQGFAAWTGRRRAVGLATIAVILAASWPGSAAALRGEIGIAGAGQRTFYGYEHACAWLAEHADSDDAIWNQSLSWHFMYCLGDTDLRSLWYPDAETISTSGAGGYLAVTELDDPHLPARLRASGWRVTPAEQFYATDGLPNIRIFALAPP